MKEQLISQSKATKLAKDLGVPHTKLIQDIRHLLAILKLKENSEREYEQMVQVYSEENLRKMILCCKTFISE